MRYIISILFIMVSLSVKAQQEVELCPNSRTTFTYWTYSSTSNGGWLWLLNSDTVSYNNNVRITWRDTGFYIITVKYKGECGEPIRFYNVKVVKCPESAIFFPNAFTPNGDGLNDGWSPIPFKITEIRWQIYNRYGEMVYQTNKLGDKWNGIYKGAPQGIFNFVFQCWWKGIDGKTGYKKGNLILIR